MAIAKVIFNGTTLMDVTSDTVTSETLKTGITATKNDGTSITGDYKAKLQDKEVILTEASMMTAPGEKVLVYFIGNDAYKSRPAYNTGNYQSLKLETIDLTKNYIIKGYVSILDDNNNILEKIIVNESVDLSTNNETSLSITSNNYITFIAFQRDYTVDTTQAKIRYGYNKGDYEIQLRIIVVEDSGEYEGLSTVTVKLGAIYNIYKCLHDKQYTLYASGSTIYGYTAEDISNWCNSFSFLRAYQLANCTFSGSFYFNNISQISYYTFAKTYIGTDTGLQGNADFYFPSLSAVMSTAFGYNTNIKYIEASICTVIGSSAFYNSRIPSVSFPLCETIHNYAFTLNNSLSVADFPECLTIGYQAFSACTLLNIANFPKCTSISGIAFSGCTRLASINFPSCSFVGDQAFYRCSSLTTVDFPECITIKSSVFKECNLLDISLPKCTDIGAYAFYSCKSLNNIELPECLSIGTFAFGLCTALSSASLPKCTQLGSSVFYSCSVLNSITLDACTTILTSVFYGCSSLESIYLPACTSIGQGAFQNCKKLSDISVPQLETIASYAFASCQVLSTISLPACTVINSYAFANCNHLLSLYLMGSSYVSLPNYLAFQNTPIAGVTASTNGEKGSIYVPASMLDTYKTMTTWVTYSSRFVGI